LEPRPDSYRDYPGYKAVSGHWRSVAVQAVSEPEIYHGTEIMLRADVRVRVQQPLQIYLGCRSTCLPCLPAGRRQAGKQKV